MKIDPSEMPQISWRTIQLTFRNQPHSSFVRLFLCGFIYLFSTATNTALVFGLKKTNKKLTMPQKLYIYLSITDGMTGLFMPYFAILDLASATTCTTFSIGMSTSMYTFGLGLGTFFVISYLRNFAIRKPFSVISDKVVYVVLIIWNVLTALWGLFSFFTYEPIYAKHLFYCLLWILSGVLMTFMVILVTYLNILSKKVLTKESQTDSPLENAVERRRRKRNKTAVSILNVISLIYAICVLPLSFYYMVLGILMALYRDNEPLLTLFFYISPFIHLPLFPCSGLNAMVYMLKDRSIKRFYKLLLCRKIQSIRRDSSYTDITTEMRRMKIDLSSL